MALPILASAQTTASTISSVVSTVISITSSGTVNINTTPTGSGVQTIASDTVTVNTNDSNGYTLGLNENGGGTNLVSGSNTIAASTGTQATPAAETAQSWGYRVDGVGGFGAGPTTSASNAAISGTIKFAGVPSVTANTLKTTATTATNDTTLVWYGIAINTAQPSGTYTNSVLYTATGN